MNYTCLGNNQYEITLTVFRDCYYGDPNAYFDNPAAIGIFNRENLLLRTVYLPFMNDDTLQPVLTDDCLVVPPTVCVHTTTYRTIVELPPVIGGYQLAYQRCCRNQTIANIVNPLGTGATYGVTISEKALLECNSNPKFQQWPPIYICANQPIRFDQSALDADGDSIVYRLCAPLTGANPSVPRPQPPFPPPYDPITWVDPPYNADNMLNGFPGGESLRIDPRTGLLTGLPNTLGQFVVGICVEEYRDGVLLSTTRRDFQYNVGLCGRSVAAFSAPEVQCGSLSVQFANQSQGASTFLWLFNDPAQPGASSSLPDPVFTFADTGRYTVMLIADPEGSCRDSFTQEIYLQPGSLIPDFALAEIKCSDTPFLQATDLSIDGFSEPVAWEWEITPGGQRFFGPDPILAITRSGPVLIRLTVTSANGCRETIEKTISADLIDDDFPLTPLVVCRGDSLELNPGFDTAYQYLWAPAGVLSDPTQPDPVVIPEMSMVFSVTVTDGTGRCRLEKDLEVIVSAPEFEPLRDTTVCSDRFTLSASGSNIDRFIWSIEPAFADPIGEGPLLEVTSGQSATYYVQFRDDNQCVAVDSLEVINRSVNIRKTGDRTICLGDRTPVGVFNLDPSDTLQLSWSPPEGILVQTGNAIVVQPSSPGFFVYTFRAVNQFGCVGTDSIAVAVIDTSVQSAFFEETQCGGYTVLFRTSSVNAPFLVWNFGDPADPEAGARGGEVAHTYPGPGEYEVMLTLSAEVPCRDTLIRRITVADPAIRVDFDWAVESCGDSIVLRFYDASYHPQAEITHWSWTFGDLGSSPGSDAVLVLAESGDLPVQLFIQTSDGCRDSLTRIVTVELLEVNLADTLVACGGTAVELNPDGDPGYAYQWSPPDGLDDATAANPLALPERTTTYLTVVSDSAGLCRVERRVTVVVPPPISYELAPGGLTCEENYLLYAYSGQAQQWLWASDSLFTQVIGTDPELWVRPDSLSRYYVKLTDRWGCVATDEVWVAGQGIRVGIVPLQTICTGDSTWLAVENPGGQNLQYLWSPPDAILAGENSPAVLVSPSVPTTYSLRILNEFGCRLDTSIMVDVFNYTPPLAIFADQDTLIGPGTVQLQATEDETYLYFWSADAELSDSRIPDPTAMVEQTSTFSLTIRDPSGCINRALITIVVIFPDCRPPSIFVPNAFTPNGDQVNDQLFVRGWGMEELVFVIYDRWGEEVFRTQEAGEGWDGTFRGEPLPPDVYGYWLTVRCVNGETFQSKGNITLIR